MMKITIQEPSKDSLIRRKFVRFFRQIGVLHIKTSTEHRGDSENGSFDIVDYIFRE